MGFIGSVISAIVMVVVAIIIYIVDVVVNIVKVIIHLIMILLGWKPDGQTVEYFEVRNVPLFNRVDQKNPLLETVRNATYNNENLSANIVYSNTYRSLKADFRTFMKFIEDGSYFESFPTVESFILVIDYDELTAALTSYQGAPSTPGLSRLDSLKYDDWVKAWLQDNKSYNVGANSMGSGNRTVTTIPITPATTTYTVSSTGISYTLSITDEVATEDAVTVNSSVVAVTSPITPGTTGNTRTLGSAHIAAIGDEIATSDIVISEQEWHVDFGTIAYNAGANNYTVEVTSDSGVRVTLPYTIPSIPTELHYISQHYVDSAPTREYIFIYKVGAGTYPALDTVESPIDQSGSILQSVPDIPLRISNSDYTTFGATKAQQIEDLCDLVTLDAAEILNKVMSDPGSAPGDIDNVYISFGVRMRDTSQVATQYLFEMFENLYPSQAVTQGVYNSSATGDDKPQNNIITTTDDNKKLFQFSYITFAHTTLAAINADPGGNPYSVYYSDASRFNSSNILSYPYYSSSAKTTYNVGFKASTLAEVANFLSGSGTVNPGPVSTEGANWLQPTTRMPYNNPSPILQNDDGTTSGLIYLTPDMVFENNGLGGLRVVKQAEEQTTVGQSVTYYYIDGDGIDAYTVVAPTAALKVIDGDSGVFKTVTFNLGNEDDLMVPMVHTFIKDMSNRDVTRTFLAGAHVSIYIAHYEVIQPASMSFLTALVLLIIIVVVIYFAWQAGAEFIGNLLAEIAVAATTGAVLTIITTAAMAILKKLLISYAIQLIITEVAKSNEELAIILAIAGAAYMGQYGVEGALTGFDYAKMVVLFLNSFASIQNVQVELDTKELERDTEQFLQTQREELFKLNEEADIVNNILKELYNGSNTGTFNSLTSEKRVRNSPMDPATYYLLNDEFAASQIELVTMETWDIRPWSHFD